MNKFVIVRGGGDLATGVIHRLASAGFDVLVLEAKHPAAIRRQVSLSEAVYEGTATVEGLTARLISDVSEMEAVWAAGEVPMLVDPEAKCLETLKPAALVDAIIAKYNVGTHRGMAPRTIALGPGFVAGEDVDVVIETSRGHKLGRVITEGAAKPNTGIPGIIGGYGKERVMHSPAKGVLRNVKKITDTVSKGDIIAVVETEDGPVPVEATLDGILRGLIRDGYPVKVGFKMADIDPRADEYNNCFTISDKARCIAGGVLEAILQRKGELGL